MIMNSRNSFIELYICAILSQLHQTGKALDCVWFNTITQYISFYLAIWLQVKWNRIMLCFLPD